MESDYDYWWWNTAKIIKKRKEYKKSFKCIRHIDGLLKYAKNKIKSLKTLLKTFQKSIDKINIMSYNKFRK